MNDEIRQRLQTLRDGLSVQSEQVQRLPTAAEIVELIDCVLAVEPVVNNVSITNNRVAEDRVGESCAKLVAAEERLAQARRRADAEGLVGLPNIGPDAIKFTGQLVGVGVQGLMETLSVKRPWWKFWA